MDEGLKKSPHWPEVVVGDLIAAVLGAIAEALEPREARIELRRGEVEAIHEPSKPLQVVIH